MTKAIQIRVYRDDETDWRIFKFVFAEDVRQDFIDYFNRLYQEEWDKYEKKWIKVIGKMVKETREEENKKEIEENAVKMLK